MRLLFVVPPLVGHINPTVAVGAELAKRGCEVAWAGHPATLRRTLADDASILPVLDDALAARIETSRNGSLGLRGPAALKFFWEDFAIPLGHGMLHGVEAALAGFQPDVVVSDQQALAGALAARRATIPWVTSATTSSEFTRPLANLPKVEDWVRECIDGFQRACGVQDGVDLRFSDKLVLAFTTQTLVGGGRRFPPHYVFTGPALTARPEPTPFPWDWLVPGRKRVLVSLGTVYREAGRRFFAVALEAFADLGAELQVIVVAPPDVVADPPEHVLVVDFIPQLAVLRHVDAVVSHGGHNTVCEALAHGRPLVVAAIRDDQPIIAQQVADAGAGIRLRFARVSAAELRGAVLALLGDPSYREAAARIQESFRLAGGAAAAADRLERVA